MAQTLLVIVDLNHVVEAPLAVSGRTFYQCINCWTILRSSILKVSAHANSQELARLTAADETQENKLKALQAGAKFKAVCDLAFSSGAQYMSFEGCVFK